MTKDRPRNRPGNGPKSGGFRGSNRGAEHQGARGGGDEPWGRDAERSGGAGNPDDDKPWTRRERGGDPKRGPERSAGSGDGPRRFKDKPGKFGDKPRGKFDGPRGRDGAQAEFRGKTDRSDRQHEARDQRPARNNDIGHAPPRRRDHRASGQWDRRDAAFEENGEVWIWGMHAAGAALANPKRRISKAWLSRNAAARAGLDPDALPAYAELMEPKEMDQRLPPGAVHQGLAIRCKPLDGAEIEEAAARPEKPLVILDQVTDPQNVGAVFRSAAAFGLAGVVMQMRNAPSLGGALAKAAAGGLEQVDEIRAVNLSRAIDTLRDAGWKVIGLDGSAEQTLDEAFAGQEPLAIVMGAEGDGIRYGVAKACSGLARIPMGGAMESLNVSNAAAIAFYEAARRNGAAPPAPRPSSNDADGDGVEDETD